MKINGYIRVPTYVPGMYNFFVYELARNVLGELMWLYEGWYFTSHNEYKVITKYGLVFIGDFDAKLDLMPYEDGHLKCN